MAVDEVLLESVRGGGPPVLRLYRWAPACLSLGRNQPARGRYDEEAIRRAGVDVVRRLTGGRAVLHDRELTYSVLAPEGALGSPRVTYRRVHAALVLGLRRLGVPAAVQVRTGRRAAVPSLVPCFQEPVEGEVVADGRKLVGSAQLRLGGALLQHGSLLIDGSQGRVRTWTLGDGVPRPEEAPATLAGLLGAAPPWEALVDALVGGWRGALEVALLSQGLSGPEADAAARLERRYQDPTWTWHR
jgi:lipoyl(octanoyl) transferase